MLEPAFCPLTDYHRQAAPRRVDYSVCYGSVSWCRRCCSAAAGTNDAVAWRRRTSWI